MRKKTSEDISFSALGAIVALALVAAVTLYREGPSMRRYLRILRM